MHDNFSSMASRFLRFHLPIPIRSMITHMRMRGFYRKLETLRQAIIEDLSINLTKISEEERKTLAFLKNNNLTIFSNEFEKRYCLKDVHVFFDNNLKMSYVVHEQKRMYFPEDMDPYRIKHYYMSILKEQDKDSSHCYNSAYTVPCNSVLVDIGSAEGNFGLDNIENIKHLYLFEGEAYWNNALKATFAPWKEKVTIINKWVGSSTDNNQISLDTYFKDKKIDVIKMDVEGSELNILYGAKDLIVSQAPVFLICTYHKADDATNIPEAIQRLSFNNYEFKYTPKQMIFYFDNSLFHQTHDYLRHGLVCAHKHI